jgi:hypothetical protein
MLGNTIWELVTGAEDVGADEDGSLGRVDLPLPEAVKCALVGSDDALSSVVPAEAGPFALAGSIPSAERGGSGGMLAGVNVCAMASRKSTRSGDTKLCRSRTFCATTSKDGKEENQRTNRNVS